MGGKLKVYLNLLRIKDWRGYFLMSLFGFIVSKGFLFPLQDIIVFYTMVLLFLAFGFSINECFDTEEDKHIKDRINPLVVKEINFRKSLFFSILLGASAVALSMIFGLKIFLFCLAGTLIVFSYSAPPFRTKSRPWLDLISHGLFAGVFFVVLPFLVFNIQMTMFHYLITFSIFYLSVTLELRNHLEDYETDKNAGLRTTVCVLGYERSDSLLKYLAILYPLILLPIFLLISQKYLFLFLIFTLIFLFLLLFKKNSKIVRNYRAMDIYTILSLGLLSLVTIF